jgi:hypothetical protein
LDYQEEVQKRNIAYAKRERALAIKKEQQGKADFTPYQSMFKR